MPFYRVWYQNKPEPLEFSSAARVREDEIFERVFAHENIALPAESGPSLADVAASHQLAPLRYTEDEGEPYTLL